MIPAGIAESVSNIGFPNAPTEVWIKAEMSVVKRIAPMIPIFSLLTLSSSPLNRYSHPI